MLAVFLYARRKKLNFLTLTDVLAPGVLLAQAIGRWGNYFNMECYGPEILSPALQFFPVGVLIPDGTGGYVWHMATFFYESLWNLCGFLRPVGDAQAADPSGQCAGVVSADLRQRTVHHRAAAAGQPVRGFPAGFSMAESGLLRHRRRLAAVGLLWQKAAGSSGFPCSRPFCCFPGGSC